MVRLFVFLAALALVLAALTLISALSAERVRTLPRALWVVLIVLVPLLGPLAFLAAGRPQTRPGPGTTRRRTNGPDDDPEFLRRLGRTRRNPERDLFDQWERELRRPDDPRRPGPGVRPDPDVPPEG